MRCRRSAILLTAVRALRDTLNGTSASASVRRGLRQRLQLLAIFGIERLGPASDRLTRHAELLRRVVDVRIVARQEVREPRSDVLDANRTREVRQFPVHVTPEADRL